MSGIDLVRRDVRALRAYEEEAGGGLNLSANTSLFGPNPVYGRGAWIQPDGQGARGGKGSGYGPGGGT